MIVSEKIYGRILNKKKALDTLRPLDKFKLEKLKDDFIVEYAHNSTAIEGNTLTLNETKLILQEGITIGGKSIREHLDVTNQKEAFFWIEQFIKNKKELSESDIITLHKITLKGISEYWAGRYKTSQNRIVGSQLKTTPPYKVQSEMGNLVYILNKNPQKYNPVELVAFAHYEFVRIHPFVDGNGRTARLLCNILLMGKGYPPIIIGAKERKKYFNVLEKANFKNIKPFTDFIAQKIEESLTIYISSFEKSTPNNMLVPLSDITKKTKHSQEYLSLLARKGVLPAVKINNAWHTSLNELNEYLGRIDDKKNKTKATKKIKKNKSIGIGRK